MSSERNAAAIVGPTALAMALGEALNASIFVNTDPQLTFLDGALLFIAGVSLLRAHSAWVMRWPVVITILGWTVAGVGLSRLIEPTVEPGPTSGPGFIAGLVVLVLLGLFLSWKGYGPED